MINEISGWHLAVGIWSVNGGEGAQFGAAIADLVIL